MKYKDALNYIDSVCWKGSVPGLERISKLMDRLGNPQNNLRFIHVAGTNGKGSVCAMLSHILKEAGYKTGCFTSPYVKYFEERMQIDGKPIGKRELSELCRKVKAVTDTMDESPTEFELITALGFLYFKKHNCDIVVLEVGMGGRLDSTNIVKTPVLSIISGIALDHTKILGDTVEKIAAEKAGIIKPGVPVIYGGDDDAAYEVIKKVAASRNSPCKRTRIHEIKNSFYNIDGCTFDYNGRTNINISLAGIYQPKNAALVLDSIDILNEIGYSVNDTVLRNALKDTYWPARFECLRKLDPTVIYDGGHNPQGVKACADSIKQIFNNKKVVILSGVMSDKDYTSMTEILKDIAESAYTVKPDNPRAMSSVEYAEQFKSQGIDVKSFPTVMEGFKAAYYHAKNNSLPLLVLGSLYLYSELYDCAEKVFNSDK